METVEILQILAQGEDSRNQFKKDVNNVDSLAIELIAFSNTLGGKLFVGVDENAEKKGEIIGLSSSDLHRINQLISNAASQNIKPAINPLTEVVTIDGKRILIIDVPKGINKPYQDKNGAIWMKNGADKRKATSREELQRLFQSSGMLHADIIPANGMTVSDLDMPYFRAFFQKRYDKSLDEQQIPLEQLISNLNLGENGSLNLTGALLFSQTPSSRLPSYAYQILPYRGFGSGILRALEKYPDIDFIDDREGNLFKCIILRMAS